MNQDPSFDIIASMKAKLARVLVDSTNLAAVRDKVVALFDQTRQRTGTKRIGYVAGIINSDGPEKVEENRQRLAEYTERIREEQDFPIFSATDIFSKELFAKLEEVKLGGPERNEAFMRFWREILESGNVTDIFMTPRWEQSVGATDEHKTATKLGITIHCVGAK